MNSTPMKKFRKKKATKNMTTMNRVRCIPIGLFSAGPKSTSVD